MAEAIASRSDWCVALKVLALANDRQLRCDAVGCDGKDMEGWDGWGSGEVAALRVFQV